MSDQLDEIPQQSFAPIAIVGVSALLPDAPDISSFWNNVLNAHVSIKEVPKERWNSADFWVEGQPGSAIEGKTYSKIGAFVEQFEFDWRRWKQPPGTLGQIDDTQLWAVEVSAAALEDAGYLGEDPRLDLPKERCGVIFANALGGENRLLSSHRIYADQFARKAIEAGMPTEAVEQFKQSITEGKPRIDEDTMPGELANVVAGRVANLLDLQGPNFSADAACASTFAALLSACQMLQTRQTDVMLCGASDCTMDPGTYAKFSAIGALSPIHSRPFDARANGFVMGEGAGCVVLKRLEDAIRDGDEIYSVIRGIGASSDGRGKGITAPSTRGQKQAVMRAYQQAGYSPTSVELIEAHGTSTKVGDATELSTLAEVYSERGVGDHVAVGSVKSQIGHLKAAAGMAGLLKASLALHHRTLPPSAGFEQPNTSVNWDEIPFFVPTSASEWPIPPSGMPRRAGISSFGFGGTNFHCAIEQYDPEYHLKMINDLHQSSHDEVEPPSAPSVLDQSATPSMTHDELKAIEGGLLLLNAPDLVSLTDEIAMVKTALLAPSSPTFDESPNGRRLSVALAALSHDFKPEGVRCGIVATNWAQLEKRLELLESNISDRSKWNFLSKQMVFITDEPPLPSDAKLVQMFPGQGSQYVGMTLDLSKRFEVVGETWVEADRTMVDILDGEKLSEFVLRENLSEEQVKIAEEKLKQTEYTQPAMLTADLALYRLLVEHGIEPDMVAGHSLGEYAALMVSGIMKFHDALRAAAARGTEMGSVDVPDKGIMASVTAPFDKVQEVINSVDGYVIAANKNSPLMTVIAGETEAMEKTIRRFAELNVQCVKLQTSHAFHSKIVAPANEPLRQFLDDLELSLPTIPITSNYDGNFYPDRLMDGQSIHQAILGQLAPQMSSAVEWTEQVRKMYGAGGRLFMEVGPKRALALFAEQILADQPKVVTNTNHPKVGGVASFLSSLAICSLAGRQSKMHALDSSRLTEGFRAGPVEIWQKAAGLASEPEISSSELEELRIRSRPFPSATSTIIPSTATQQVIGQIPDIDGYLAARISETSGYPARLVKGELELATLGITGDGLSNMLARIASESSVSHPIDDSLTTLPSLVGWVTAPPSGFTKSAHGISSGAVMVDPLVERKTNPYVVTGVSLGLPGMDEVFSDDALERIIAGENFITELPDEMKQRLLDKNMVRIVKHQDGRAEFVPCDSFSTIPQLAGVGGYFDLAEQYGIDPKIVAAMDVSTTLSFAAGLEALKDAGLPLVPVEQVSSAGKRLVRGWNLPSTIKERTGIVFASVWPGLAMAMRHAQNNGADDSGTFDRRFLLQVLTMGHAQFAQWIGARGPNAAINNACASTPAAFAIAEDWLSTGRCDRVIVISGDDSTGDDLMEWLGTGFAAAGAHSMGNVVEEVALPFDARRNGMLLGMGGAAFVLEKSSHASERGVVPYAELLGAHIGNSAFHPTRLDVGHVAATFEEFVTKMENDWGIDRHSIAPRTTFMSHEPFTPPRGGSASAEVESLRGAFGSSTDELIITNTKGFTGHPMGVGIEDATGLYGLASGRLPPIANFREADPELGNLRLSEGGEYDIEYMFRHAAGFGSQIALTFFKRVARSINRIDKGSVDSWVASQVEDEVITRILKRKLVAYVSPDDSLIGGVEGEDWQPAKQDAAPESAPKPTPQPAKAEQTKEAKVTPQETPLEPIEKPEEEPEPVTHSPPQSVGEDVVVQVVETVAEHTGYPTDFIELDQDLEGELGIDTVKQAEIMADLREKFSLPVDESFQLREHPTLNHMISYISKMAGGDSTPIPPPAQEVQTTQPTVEEVIQEVTKTPTPNDSEVESAVLSIVVKHTGYPEDFLELDQDLEGELGIDTVKQAEIMADCRERFSLPVDESFQLREYPTLAHMISYIISMGGGNSQNGSSVEVEEETSQPHTEVVESPPVEEELPSVVDEIGVRRWVVEVEEAEESEPHPIQMSGSYMIVTDDSWGLGDAICQELEKSGTEAVRLMLDPSITSKVRVEKEGEVDIIRLDPGNEAHLSQVGAILAPLDVVGVIHTAPCTLAGMAWAEVTSKQQTQMVCHGLFGLLRIIDGKLAERNDGIVCSISALDGRHGNGGHRFNALGAGAHGIVKSYGRERPNIRARAIDVAPELLVDAVSLASTILREIEQMGPRELGIDADGSRWSVCIYDEPHEAERKPLESDDVLLVSGGGSGVTAACMVGLAEANQDVGAHFALLGRTKLVDSLVSKISASEEELQQMKMEVREELQMGSEKVTIVEWENAWSKVVRSIDVHKTLDAIRQSGNTASYHACDITEGKQIRKVLKKLKKKRGPVTGIIHGAGIEDSKLVSDKQWSTFSQVMAVKVDGWQALVNAVNDHSSELRYCCVFTSIAGRFGNGGQTDYAAANCILDAEMSRLSHIEDEPQGIALAWTGWRDVGMATRGSIEKVFEEAGIETVSVEQGVELFVDEVMRGGKRRVVLAGQLGVLNDDGSDREPPQRLAADVSALLADANRFPFVDKIISHEPFDQLSYECTLDVERYPFLVDHAIDGVPYHPVVMVLEMFGQASQLLWPPCSVIGFDDVNFGLPVKLLHEEQKVRVVAQFARQDDDSVWVSCRLESDLINKAGEVFGEPRVHHEGVVRMLKVEADRGLLRLPSIGMPSQGSVSANSDFVYDRFFHGPKFQSHGGISTGCMIDNMIGIDGIALSRHQLPDVDLFADGMVELEAQPMLIEACFQNAGMVAMEVDELQSLPIGIEQVELIRTPGVDDKLSMRSLRKGAEDGGVTLHDCLIVNQDSKPVLALNNLRLKGMAPISEAEKFTLNRN